MREVISQRVEKWREKWERRENGYKLEKPEEAEGKEKQWGWGGGRETRPLPPKALEIN